MACLHLSSLTPYYTQARMVKGPPTFQRDWHSFSKAGNLYCSVQIRAHWPITVNLSSSVFASWSSFCSLSLLAHERFTKIRLPSLCPCIGANEEFPPFFALSGESDSWCARQSRGAKADFQTIRFSEHSHASLHLGVLYRIKEVSNIWRVLAASGFPFGR